MGFKSFFQFVMIVGLSALSLGCHRYYRGEFVATKDLKFFHKNRFEEARVKKVPAGKYRAVFKVVNSFRMEFSFEYPGVDYGAQENAFNIKIELPLDMSFPSSEENFSFLAEDSGQFYDIEADVKSKTSRSEMINRTLSCDYTEDERHCERVCTPFLEGEKNLENTENSGENCRSVCRSTPVEKSGYRRVNYEIVRTTRTIAIDLFNPETREIVGTYEGENVSSEKEYSYKGPCE